MICEQKNFSCVAYLMNSHEFLGYFCDLSTLRFTTFSVLQPASGLVLEAPGAQNRTSSLEEPYGVRS
jgi:hypothetical protein